MARKSNNRIQKEHLILCEGRDAEEFLIAYLNSEALSDIPFFSQDIQVMDFGGNENLKNYIELLKNMEGFRNVKSLVIIRDAERDAQRAVVQIQGALQSVGVAVPPVPWCWAGEKLKVGFLLFPMCDSNIKEGTLEDLCLSILAEENSPEILDEIDRFMQQLMREHARTFPHEFKTKLHSYFSVTDKFVSLKIGEAAWTGAFNWNSEKLLPLKNFVLKVATGN